LLGFSCCKKETPVDLSIITLYKQELLIALVEPSRQLASGFATITLTLVTGNKITGLLLKDKKDRIRVKLG